MRTFLSTLIAIEVLGIVAGAIAALVEIETIVCSGPMICCAGLLTLGLCYHRSLQVGFWFGLSLPTISILCFALIFGGSWSPEKAAKPIGSLVALFTCVGVPLGCAAFEEVRQSILQKRSAKLQFGLTTLLGVMFLSAISFGLVRMEDERSIAIGIMVVYTMMAAYVVKMFYRSEGTGRRESRSSEPGVTPNL